MVFCPKNLQPLINVVTLYLLCLCLSQMDVTDGSFLSLFSTETIVYLTPDAESGSDSFLQMFC